MGYINFAPIKEKLTGSKNRKDFDKMLSGYSMTTLRDLSEFLGRSSSEVGYKRDRLMDTIYFKITGVKTWFDNVYIIVDFLLYYLYF